MRKVVALVVVALWTCGATVRAAGQSSAGQRRYSGALVSSIAPDGAKGDGDLRSAPDTRDLERRDQRYRLCASDVIALMFPLTPEFDETVSIQPDGFASLMGAGDVRLAGLTRQEATAAVQTAYAGILRDPVVTLELKDFNKPYFIVGGQVGHPGKYDLRGDTTATQAIAIAGGFNDFAKHSQVLLFRRVNSDWYEVKQLNLKRILTGRGIAEDPGMRSGDMLYVPQSFISKVKKFIPAYGLGAYYQLHP